MVIGGYFETFPRVSLRQQFISVTDDETKEEKIGKFDAQLK